MKQYDFFKEEKPRRLSILWLTSFKKMKQNEAEIMVDEIISKLPRCYVRYLMAVVQWSVNGELDLTKESEILRVKKLFADYARSFMVEHKGNGVLLVYDGMCFKRLNVGKPASCLWTMKEVEEALRHR